MTKKKKIKIYNNIISICAVMLVAVCLFALGHAIFEFGKFKAEEALWKQARMDELRSMCTDAGEAFHVGAVYFNPKTDARYEDSQYYGYCELRFPNPATGVQEWEVNRDWVAYGLDDMRIVDFTINKLKEIK